MRLARTAAPLPRCVAGLAGWSRTSGLRFPKPAGWPSPLQPDENPRRDSNPRFRAENPASLPLDHGGMSISRRPWNRTRPCSISASRAATDTDLRWFLQLRPQDSNLRDASNSRASDRSTTPDRTCSNSERKERESNPQRPKPHPFSRRDTAPMAALPEVAPAGIEPAPRRLRVGSSAGLSYGAVRCGRQESNLRRVAVQATALPC